jgi:hypothetical protein
MFTVAASNSTANAIAQADFVCDGINDQVEINAAIQALGGQPGTVFLYDGDYNLGASTSTAAIVIDQSNLTLQGESHAVRLTLQDHADVNMIRTVGNGLTNIRITNLSLFGNSANNSSGETLEDRFEHNIIRAISDGTTFNSNIWVTNIHAEDANRVAVMLGGNDMHVRDSTFGNAGSDVVEVLYGTGSDITNNVAYITGITGYVFGSDAASGVSIRNNTTHVLAGGVVEQAVHRLWGGQTTNLVSGNTILVEPGGKVNHAVEANGYLNLITGNLFSAPGNGDDGRMSVHVNNASSIVNNYLVNTDITTAYDSPGYNIFISGNSGVHVGLPTQNPDVTLSNNSFFGVTTDSSNDAISGTGGNDILSGGAGNDTIHGLAGTDLIRGGRDDDLLFGGEGNDYIDGGFGFDRMSGGSGNDWFIFSQDTRTEGNFITDYSAADTLYFGGVTKTPNFSVSGTDVYVQNIGLINAASANVIAITQSVEGLAGNVSLEEFQTIAQQGATALLTFGAYERHEFDANSNESWRTRTEAFDANGALTRFVEFFDTGESQTIVFDTTNASWSFERTDRTASSQISFNQFYRDDTSRINTTFDTGTFGSLHYTIDEIDSSGVLRTRTDVYDNGNIVTSNYTLTGEAWYTRQINTDGSRIQTNYDIGNNAWLNYSTSYNSQGQVYGENTTFDDNTRLRTWSDVAGATWYQIQEGFDAAGNKDWDRYQYDDGSVTYTDIDQLNAHATWNYHVTQYNSAGVVIADYYTL